MSVKFYITFLSIIKQSVYGARVGLRPSQSARREPNENFYSFIIHHFFIIYIRIEIFKRYARCGNLGN